ncbi:MAG: hypothetical protein U0694_02170 [Anaerolineae bacterium]
MWLAFTGAEETGCLGAHALLDTYGAERRTPGSSILNRPARAALPTSRSTAAFRMPTPIDPMTSRWRGRWKQHAPTQEMGIRGAPMTIVEEIGALRWRGYRGICLAGVGDDGWLMNWHQYSDNAANIVPACIEKAAHCTGIDANTG